MSSSGSRILVTGGAGYIGSVTVRHLLERGHEVVVYDNLVYGHREAVDCRLVEGDIGDSAKIAALCAEAPFDAAIHFAAYAYVGESVQDPRKYFHNNVVQGLQFLDALVDAGVGRVVFSSTCATYGQPEAMPIVESTPQRPTNPYGETKLWFERILRWYGGRYPLHSIALRYFNAAGADPSGEIGEDHDPETHLIPNVLTALRDGGSVTLFGDDYPTPDGTCIRDYIHVTDLARAHVLAVERLLADASEEPLDVFNLGTGVGTSNLEVVRTAEQVTGKTVDLRMGPRRAGDPPVLVASNEKARAGLGWSPDHSDIRTVLETAWRWHGSRPNGFASR